MLSDMKQYISTYRPYAKPMTRQAYVDFRGWKLPKGADGTDEGYFMEYTNAPQYSKHISWIPKDVFERSYEEVVNAA